VQSSEVAKKESFRILGPVKIQPKKINFMTLNVTAKARNRESKLHSRFIEVLSGLANGDPEGCALQR
jgi:hypothetical protein